jgi:ferric iron reductase protein FhuF
VPVATVEELRQRAFERLFRDHVVPAVEQVHCAIGVSWKLIWSTVAESIEYMYKHARPHFDDAAWASIADGLLSAEERHRLHRQYLTQRREETSCRWPPRCCRRWG